MNSNLANLVKNNSTLYRIYVLVRDRVSYLKGLIKRSYSQHNEDTLILEYFGQGFVGKYLDVGCSHPFRISNTYKLYQAGWSGVVVDPIPEFRELYQIWRPKDVFVNAGIGRQSSTLDYFQLLPSVLSSFDRSYVDRLVGSGVATLHKQYKVPVYEVNEFIGENFVNDRLDFMSLDVENLDVEILRAMCFDSFAPKMICVEYNTSDDEALIIELLSAKQYSLYKKTKCNLLMVYELTSPPQSKPRH